jgi:hypothetical protein
MWVLTADGAKSIADVKVGDRVLSSDAAGRQVEADVIKTYAEQGYHYFLINDRIKVTALHRFFTDHGWKKARELKAGDRIMTQDGRFEEILALEWLAADLDVYNLTISVNHNFYIHRTAGPVTWCTIPPAAAEAVPVANEPCRLIQNLVHRSAIHSTGKEIMPCGAFEADPGSGAAELYRSYWRFAWAGSP